MVPALSDWPDPAAKVRDCSVAARSAGWLDRLTQKDRAWLHRQLVCECVNVWSAYDERLRAACPQACGILELVVIAAEATPYFGRGAGPGDPTVH